MTTGSVSNGVVVELPARIGELVLSGGRRIGQTTAPSAGRHRSGAALHHGHSVALLGSAAQRNFAAHWRCPARASGRTTRAGPCTGLSDARVVLTGRRRASAAVACRQRRPAGELPERPSAPNVLLGQGCVAGLA